MISNITQAVSVRQAFCFPILPSAVHKAYTIQGICLFKWFVIFDHSFAYMIGILPVAKYSSKSELNMFKESIYINDYIYEDYFRFDEQ